MGADPFKVLAFAFAAGMTLFAIFVTMVCVAEFMTPPLIGWSPSQVFVGRASAVLVTVMGWGASAVIWWAVITQMRD